MSDTPTPQPARLLGLVPATALVVGTMLGVGIFIGPPQMAAISGSETLFLLLWLGGGVTALCGALSVAELSALLPFNGGHYVYLRKVYGPGIGFAAGWLEGLAVFPGSIGTLALAVGTFQLPALFGPSVLEPFVVGPISIPAPLVWGTLIVVAFTALNHLGIVLSGRVQTALTALPVLLFFGGAVWVIAAGHHASLSDVPEPATSQAMNLAAAYLPVYFAYAGWEGAIYVAGEIKNPGRNLPRALIVGTSLVTLLYFVLTAGFATLFSLSQLSTVGEAGSAAAGHLFGRPGTIAMTGLILVGLLGSLNAQVLTGSRITNAMSIDGEFVRSVARLSRRFGTPAHALWLQAAWTVVLMAFQRVDQLIAYATAAMLMIGVLSVLSVGILRRREPDAQRPYRTLFYPATPVLYIVSSVVVLAILIRQADVSVLLAVGWFVLALVLRRLAHARKR